MVQDKNEHNLSEGEGLSPSELEKLRHDLKKEHDEAISSSKNAKANILHELEQDESHSQREAAKEMMRQADAPEIVPENNSPEKNQLDEMFREIKTDDAVYQYSRTLFPKFTQTCESSRLGQNFPRDILGLALGIGDSLLSVLRLSGHVAFDAARLVIHPIKSYRETKEIMY